MVNTSHDPTTSAKPTASIIQPIEKLSRAAKLVAEGATPPVKAGKVCDTVLMNVEVVCSWSVSVV